MELFCQLGRLFSLSLCDIPPELGFALDLARRGLGNLEWPRAPEPVSVLHAYDRRGNDENTANCEHRGGGDEQQAGCPDHAAVVEDRVDEARFVARRQVGRKEADRQQQGRRDEDGEQRGQRRND